VLGNHREVGSSNLPRGTYTYFQVPYIKLLILLLYETGARPSEILNLTKDDVVFDEKGALLFIKGKTGERTLRVVFTANLLKAYLKVCKGLKIFDKRLESVEKMLKKVAKLSGINRRVYPYLFRHTRYTHLLPYMNDEELKIYFGWSRNSRMTSYYGNLRNLQIDRKIIQIAKQENFLSNKIQ